MTRVEPVESVHDIPSLKRNFRILSKTNLKIFSHSRNEIIVLILTKFIQRAINYLEFYTIIIRYIGENKTKGNANRLFCIERVCVRVSRVRSFARQDDAMERIPINYAQWRASNSMDCKLGLRCAGRYATASTLRAKPVCKRLVFRCWWICRPRIVCPQDLQGIEIQSSTSVPIEYRYTVTEGGGGIETAGGS